jgi:2-polyprenyl-3-methyl-5-hydroxy-6-metoxy-1,4-benzoquinol methylase
MAESNTARDQALEINREQKAFYEKKVEHQRRLNPVMKLWEAWRDRVYRTWEGIGVFDDVLSLHREWAGDLSGKRILDLGCYTGNRLSLELASKSRFYLGIDLSENALAKLRERLEKANIRHAEVRAVDFLSKDFDYEPFDLIYCNAVLHHFKDFDLVMSLLAQRLAPGGRVVSFDPLETALVVRFVRWLYRPFQTNAAWEWPFRQHNFDTIQKYFRIEKIQGVVGLSKWVLPFAALPLFSNATIRLGRRLHRTDLSEARQLDSRLWRCMSVNLCLVQKSRAATSQPGP